MNTQHNELVLNPHRAFAHFAQQCGIDTSKRITVREYRMLFLRLIEQCLTQNISTDAFFAYIGVLDFTPFSGKLEGPKMIIDPRTPADLPEAAPGGGTLLHWMKLSRIFQICAPQGK